MKNLKLISIHINKCAGTSFYKVLRNNYQNVLKIHTNSKSYHRSGRSVYSQDLLRSVGEMVDVIHGHFDARDVLPLLGKVPIITFIREPVDRVISNYFYDVKKYGITDSILHYAEREENRNVISKRLDGIDLEDLFFIGEKKHLGWHISVLGGKLGWLNNTIPYINVNVYKRNIPNILRELIAILNKDDINLYQRYKDKL